jgi:hypothetical protein
MTIEIGHRVFLCERCGEEISSWGTQDDRNVCHLCRWIDDNTKLTEEEKVELRKRLRKEPNTPDHGMVPYPK